MAHEWGSLDEVFDYALGEERKAEELYRALEGQAPWADLKALFGELASAEAGHFRRLLELRRATAGAFDARDALRRVPRPPAATLEARGITDMASAYRYAIRAEKGAACLYASLGDLATAPEVRRTFEWLAQEELGHKARLEADRAKRRKGGFLKRLFRFAPSP